jgi:hypothetical protein
MSGKIWLQEQKAKGIANPYTKIYVIDKKTDKIVLEDKNISDVEHNKKIKEIEDSCKNPRKDYIFIELGQSPHTDVELIKKYSLWEEHSKLKRYWINDAISHYMNELKKYPRITNEE